MMTTKEFLLRSKTDEHLESTLNTYFGYSPWIIDSGATSHMCHDRSLLYNLTSINPVQIHMANDQPVRATEAGTAKVKTVAVEKNSR